jgi:ribonuclease HI
LYELADQHDVKWRWIKGHTGHPQNERVDALATAARERQRVARTETDSGTAAAVPVDAPPAKLAIGVTCRGSIGPGAWAVVIERQIGRQALHERVPETTSNRLYLAAATAGLRALDAPHRVAVYAASSYLVRGASEWVHGWQRRGWRTAGGSAVKNQAQWQDLLQAAGRHRVTWHLPQDEAQNALAQAKEIAEREAAR